MKSGPMISGKTSVFDERELMASRNGLGSLVVDGVGE